MKARKKKAAKRAAKRTTEITEKVAANAEDKKAEVVDSTEKTAAAQDTTKKEVKAEPAKEEKKPEVKAEPVKEEKKTEAKVEPVKEEKKPEVKAEPVKKETEKAESTKELEQEFERRMARHYDELKWLYCELYENRMDMFENLCKNLKNIYMDRKPDLKKQDRVREQNPEWYKKNDILGMMMYVNAFAGNLKGVKEKLDYVQECNVNYLHLMPLLESPEGKSDGGYAVSDFRKVQPELGTMEDLESLADECRKKGISLCMDFVMNHTSEDHEWARRARAGEREYMDRYYFYDNYDVPSQFEQTVPQVFPTTAPGNFTWLDDMKKFGVDGMDGILGVENFDTSLAEGVMLLTPFSATSDDEKSKAFVDAYEAANKDEVPNQFAADAYDVIYAMQLAANDAGITPDMSNEDISAAMSASMLNIELDGLTGKAKWTEDGECDKEPKAFEIKDGAYVEMK